ncbi:MAG: cobalamin biosynthesis protein, partial [Nitrosopumilus sp.]
MIIESLFIIGIALLLDLKFGDPKNKYHPTAWIGSFLAKLTPITKNKNPTIEKFGGACVVIITLFIVISLLLALNIGISLITVDYVSLIVSVIIGALLLKSTIAIHGMEKHAKSVIESLD